MKKDKDRKCSDTESKIVRKGNMEEVILNGRKFWERSKSCVEIDLQRFHGSLLPSFLLLLSPTFSFLDFSHLFKSSLSSLLFLFPLPPFFVVIDPTLDKKITFPSLPFLSFSLSFCLSPFLSLPHFLSSRFLSTHSNGIIPSYFVSSTRLVYC